MHPSQMGARAAADARSQHGGAQASGMASRRNIARHSSLAEIAPPQGTRAASLLLCSEGRFMLGVRTPLVSDGRVLLRLTGIGGWGEGDETFEQTVHRESIEETGSDVRLINLRQTLVVRSPDDITLAGISRDVAPAAVVFRRFGAPPLDPWSSSYSSITPVAVYVGTLERAEAIRRPIELPLFFWLYPEQMTDLSMQDEPLEYLRMDGAELVGEPTFDTSQAVVRLTDSIQALLTALGPRAYTFLADIARLTQPARAE